jgi:hypothetical protein
VCVFFSRPGTDGPTLLDGEMIMGLDGSLIYLIYDIVALNGQDVSGMNLDQRIVKMHDAVRELQRESQAAAGKALPFAMKVKVSSPVIPTVFFS